MSYTLNYTGSEIDDILDRAAPGGALDTDIAAKQDALTFDDAPTSGSDNPVKSGGIYDAIQAGGATALAAFPTDSVSGDVVSFPDGADSIPVKAFTGSIIPQQNLNGQSAPYPAGGGKNKLPLVLADIKAANTSGTWNGNAYTIAGITYTVGVDSGGNVTGITASGTATGTAAIRVSGGFTLAAGSYKLNGCPSGGDWSTKYGVNVRYESTTHADTGTGYNISASYAISVEYSEILIRSGYTASNLQFKPMIRLATETDATFAPYSNICPISGWTGANIYRTGANVWDEQWEVGSLNWSTGAPTASNDFIRSKNFIPVTSGAVYRLISPTVGMVPYGYDENQANGQRLGNYAVANLPAVLTIPDGVHYLKWRSSAAATTYPNDVAINYPSTDTTYHAYNGQTILLDFGQTVYAGTLTALGGGLWKIQPTHAIIDLSTAAYTINTQTTGKLFNFAKSDMSRTAGLTGWAEAYQQSFVSAARDMPDYSFLIRSDANAVLVRTDGTETTLPTGSLVYPLTDASKPDPITLTGEDLQTLLGANSIWTDVGSVTGMTYRADTALYIQKLINGGTLSTLSMASPSPSLSLGRVGVLAEQEEAEPEQTEEEAEELEQTEEA